MVNYDLISTKRFFFITLTLNCNKMVVVMIFTLFCCINQCIFSVLFTLFKFHHLLSFYKHLHYLNFTICSLFPLGRVNQREPPKRTDRTHLLLVFKTRQTRSHFLQTLFNSFNLVFFPQKSSSSS